MTSSTPSARPLPPFAGRPRVAGPAGERLTVVDRLQTMAVFYIGAWAISPPLFVNDQARLVAAGAFGLWLLCELTRRNGVIARPTLTVTISIVFLAYTSIVRGYVDGVGALVSTIQTTVFVLFLIFFESARRTGLKKYRGVLWGALFLLPIWMATTISALGSDRHIARMLVRSSEEGAAYLAEGVGGYGLVYASVLAVPPLLYLLANLPPLSLSRGQTARRLWQLVQRLVVGAGALLAIVLVMRAGYSIAVAALILGAITFLLLRGRAQNRSFRIGLAIAISALALAVSQTSAVGSVLDGLSSLAGGTSYRAKIDDLRTSLETSTSVGTVYDRTERYARSATLFFENPVVGTLSSRDIGKHSAILDHFAQFGIFGGGAFLYLILSVPIMLVRASTSHARMSGVAFAYLAIVTICTLFNNISASMGFVAFLLYPLAMTYEARAPMRGRPPIRPSVAGLHPYGADLRPSGAKRS